MLPFYYVSLAIYRFVLFDCTYSTEPILTANLVSNVYGVVVSRSR